MRTETRVTYIARDGEVFIYEEDCVKHEAELIGSSLEDLIRSSLFEYGDVECPDESHISDFIIYHFNEIKDIMEGNV